MGEREYIPWITCPYCKKETIPEIAHFGHKDSPDTELDMVSCPMCDTVVNVEDDIEIKYVTAEYAAKHGWREQAD